jgi:hypothetical protein
VATSFLLYGSYYLVTMEMEMEVSVAVLLHDIVQYCTVRIIYQWPSFESDPRGILHIFL